MAEIGLNHMRILRDLRRRALRDHAPFRQDEDVLGERHHRLHDMLDHQNGDAAPAEVANDRNDVADLGRVESGQHLVEQQQLRLGGERTRKLETLAGGDRQSIGGAIEHIGQAEIAADTVGNRKRGIARPVMKMRADQDVFAHRQADKRLHDLEGARDAEPRQLDAAACR